MDDAVPFAARFVRKLAKVHISHVFNPYADVCNACDLTNAPQIRRRNLRNYLAHAKSERWENLWVGRDLGYRGGRYTGIPMVDEVHLEPWNTYHPSLALRKSTHTHPHQEATATAIFEIDRRLGFRVLHWNVFPWHPHRKDASRSNRPHTPSERQIGLTLLLELLDWIQPTHIVAIGNDAHRALQRAAIDCRKVRHPSHGGQAVFRQMMNKLYRSHV